MDSTLEIIDISGVQEFPSREVHVGAVESSSPHGFPAKSHVRLEHSANPPSPQAQGVNRSTDKIIGVKIIST